MAILNEEQEMLRDMAREWAANESPVAAFRKVRSREARRGLFARRLEHDGRDGLGRDRHPRRARRQRFRLDERRAGGRGTRQDAHRQPAGRHHARRERDRARRQRRAEGQVAAQAGERRSSSARWRSTKARATTASIRPRSRAASSAAPRRSSTRRDGATLFVVAAADGLYLVEKGDGVTLSGRKLTDQRSHAEVTFDGAAADKLAGRRRRPDRPGARPRAHPHRRRDARHGAAGVRRDARLPEAARAVQPGAGELPGAAAPHGGPVRRPGDDAQRGRRRARGARQRLRRAARRRGRQGRGQPRAAHR